VTDPRAVVKIRTPREAYLLFAGMFLAVASNNLLTPMLPAIRESMGMSLAAVGVYVSAYGMARLIVDLPSGALNTRIGPRRMVLIGVGLNAAASGVAIFAGSVGVLLAARICAGVGAGLLATVILTAMSDVAPPEIRGRVMSLYQVANNLGIAIYPLLGGGLGMLFGWRAGFVAATIAAIGSGLVLRPVMTRIGALTAPSPGKGGGGPASPMLTSRTLWMALAVVFFGVVANMINRHGFRNTVMPLVASSDLRLDGVQIATGITVMSMTGILVTIPAASLGDRIGRNRIIVFGLTVLAIGDFLFPVVATSFFTYVLAGAVIGLGDCFSSSQTAQLAGLVDQRHRSMVLASYRFFVDLGALIGPLGLAWLLERYGARTAIDTAGAILLAAAVVAGAGMARPGRRVPSCAAAEGL
jgi:DHA1 family multidrug resistance protein-like MFS transporter